VTMTSTGERPSFWREVWRCMRHQGPGYDVLDPNAVFTQRVLKVFGDAHAHEDLLWTVDGNGLVRFMVDVSDTFDWGSADGEDIRPRDLHILEEAYEDLKVLEAPGKGVAPASRTMYVGVLYAARMRQRRPMLRAYPQYMEVGALLDACGPVRTE
jgi:hypothetical protein